MCTETADDTIHDYCPIRLWRLKHIMFVLYSTWKSHTFIGPSCYYVFIGNNYKYVEWCWRVIGTTIYRNNSTRTGYAIYDHGFAERSQRAPYYFFSSFYLPESKFIVGRGYFLGKNMKTVVTMFQENVNVVKCAMKTNLIVLKLITV